MTLVKHLQTGKTVIKIIWKFSQSIFRSKYDFWKNLIYRSILNWHKSVNIWILILTDIWFHIPSTNIRHQHEVTQPIKEFRISWFRNYRNYVISSKLSELFLSDSFGWKTQFTMEIYRFLRFIKFILYFVCLVIKSFSIISIKVWILRRSNSAIKWF